VRLPRDPRVRWKDTIENPAIQQQYDKRNDYGKEVPTKEPEKNQEERQAIDHPTCAEVIGVTAGKQPDKDVGPKVRPKKYGTSYSTIKVKYDRSQKQKGQCIRNKMGKAAMKHGGGKNADDSKRCPWNNSKCTELNPEDELKVKNCPHQKDKSEWNDGASEQGWRWHEVTPQRAGANMKNAVETESKN
jgi:hypothetical protein